MSTINRRRFLRGAANSSIALSMRSLATGLPASFLLYGATHAQAAIPKKFAVIATSHLGEPISAYIPGAYAPGSDFIRPKFSELSDSEFEVSINQSNYNPSDLENSADYSIGGRTLTMARAFSALPNDMLQGTAFFNYKTNVGIHTSFGQVLRLHESLRSISGRGAEELPSALAQETATGLDTTLSTPLVLNGSLTHMGQALGSYSPLGLKNLLSSAGDGGDSYKVMRNYYTDAIYKNISRSGTPQQKRFLDKHIISSEEALTLGDQVGSYLNDIEDNGINSQITTALTAVKLKLAPVIAIRQNFGGDNHADDNFAREASETLNMISSLNHFWQTAKSLDVLDQVVFGTCDVFGRTLKEASRDGRNHNENLTTGLIIGSHLKGGAVGEINTNGNGSAQAINSRTGLSENPDITIDNTLHSYYKTIMAAAGVSDDRLENRIPDGKVVTSIL